MCQRSSPWLPVLFLALGLAALSHPKDATAQAGDPELAAWYEAARAYHAAVANGSQPRPAQSEWNEFLVQLQWAQSQLQSQEFGTHRRVTVHRVPVLRLFHLGAGGVHDIWSSDFTLDVAPTSARVTVERTTDTRVSPPEEVVKIVVTDKATGTSETYFIHDSESVEALRINTPSGRGVYDTSKQVEVGVFRPSRPGPVPGYHRPPRP